ncbi:MAG: hypothetical protein IBX72_16065 [Nitrospirae bacterium]|nr:hypothetical protein [Nitrospirota bacterium]
MVERTLVIFKPDLVKRNLIGKIINIFEEATLKVVAMKMIRPERKAIEKHYVATDAWLCGVGKKTLVCCL